MATCSQSVSHCCSPHPPLRLASQLELLSAVPLPRLFSNTYIPTIRSSYPVLRESLCRCYFQRWQYLGRSASQLSTSIDGTDKGAVS